MSPCDGHLQNGSWRNPVTRSVRGGWALIYRSHVAATELPTGTVTFLVTDIEGSTRLFHRLGARYDEILDTHRALLRTAFEPEGGAEFGCPGDGFLVAFQDAAAAVRAATNAQRALAAHEWTDSADVRVRMGIHSGSVRLTTNGGTYTGMAIHEAARIAGAGHGGQIVVSEASFNLIAGQIPEGVAATDLGEHALKDLEGNRRLYQLSIDGGDAMFPPLRTIQRTTLPTFSTSLHGRTADLDALERSLGAGARLLTLVGPGGVGKTTLALAAADSRRSAEAGTLVELAPLPHGSDADSVAVAIGAAIGVEVGDLRSLVAVLEGRAALLVLDNCEHVIGGAAAFAAECLDHCRGVTVIATSREALGVRNEKVHHVRPLALDDAVDMFVARATDARPSFVADETNQASIASICSRLDRLPLAVELAARRVRALSPQEIDARLDARFRLLTGGERTADPRQQTLEAAIDWSHDLLSDAERVVLRRLAVFAGGFTLRAAEQVCGFDPIDEFDVVDLIASLVDRSLLTLDDRNGTLRYGMLETIRAYAATRLELAGETDALRTRHLAWTADICWTLLQKLAFSGAGSLHDAAYEADNVRAAIDWSLHGGDPAEGLRVVAGAGIVGMEVGGNCFYAVPRWAEALLATGAGEPALRAQAMCSAANAASGSHDEARTRAFAESAVALARSHQLGPEIEAQAIACTAFAAAGAGNYELARPMFTEAAELARAARADGFRVFCHTFVADAAIAAGDLDGARAAAEEALDLGRRIGEGSGTARALIRLGDITLTEGDSEGAASLFTEAIATAGAAGALTEEGVAEGSLAELCAGTGDAAGCAEHLGRAITLLETVGQWYGVGQCRTGAAQLAAASGDVDTAERELAAATVAYEQSGSAEAPVSLLFKVAGVAELGGHADLAARWFARGAKLARERGLSALAAEGEANMSRVAGH